MSTPTPELGLLRAVDADDTADYLVTNLANSLTTVDSLFNQVSGHTHIGVHQGGPITSGSLKGPYDWPDWFRSTGHTSPFATTGSGAELYYDSAAGAAYVQGFNRATAAYIPLHLNGNALVCDGANNTTVGGQLKFASGGYIQDYAGGYVQINQLTVTPGTTSLAGLTVNGAETVNGNATITGTLTAGNFVSNAAVDSGDGHYYFAHNAGIYWQWNGSQLQASHPIISGGAVYLNGATTAYMNWNGTNITFNQSIQSGGAVYLAGNGGIGISWDGTGINHTHQVRGPSVYISGVITCTGRLITNNDDNGYENNLGGRLYVRSRAVHGNQVTSYGFDDNGGHSNCFLGQNNSGQGTALTYQWGTWSCVDHAFEYGLYAGPVPNALDVVNALNGYYYEHTQFAGLEPQRTDEGTLVTTPNYGFRASEVAEYLPELVGFNPLTGEPESIDLDRMTVILWEAFKQHAAKTDTRLEALERSIP